jgi:hypothetical protein
VKVWTGLIWLAVGLVLGFCEHGNELTCYIQSEGFSKFLSNCQLFKIGLPACSYLIDRFNMSHPVVL